MGIIDGVKSFFVKKEEVPLEDVFRDNPHLEFEQIVRWFNKFDSENYVRQNDEAFKENVLQMTLALQSQIKNIEANKAASIFFIFFKLHR